LTAYGVNHVDVSDGSAHSVTAVTEERIYPNCRSRWPRSPRRSSTASRLLG